MVWCRARLKVQNFQLRTEPIRLFNIPIFTPIVKDELALLNNEIQQGIALKPALHMTLCYI